MGIFTSFVLYFLAGLVPVIPAAQWVRTVWFCFCISQLLQKMVLLMRQILPIPCFTSPHWFIFPQTSFLVFCTAEQQSICLWQRCLFLVQDGISDSCFLVTISFTQELEIWMQDIDNLKFQVEQPKKLKHFKELSMSFESCSVECRDHPQAFPHWAASFYFFQPFASDLSCHIPLANSKALPSLQSFLVPWSLRSAGVL